MDRRRRVGEAVRLRVTADVRLGVFLSGGVDSSAVAASLPAGSDVRVFTAGFEEEAEDESRHADVRLLLVVRETEHIEQVQPRRDQHGNPAGEQRRRRDRCNELQCLGRDLVVCHSTSASSAIRVMKL